MKRRDKQLAAHLTSLGKACEVARGSPVASLLVPMAMQEQGLSSKLLAFEKQLEDHEVAVLELERQVAVVELEAHFQRLSDRVNETKALVALVEDQIENFRKVSLVELICTKLSTLDEVEARYGDWGHRLQQLEDWPWR